MLTAKREKFCQEMIKPKATQIQAYRAAFDARRMSRAAIDTEASKLMKDPEITRRIQELLKPVVEKIQLTLAQWVEDGLKLYRADPRKLFDQFGNPVPITELGNDEITLIEGFKFTEEYTKVKKASGEHEAVPTGYTQDYKMTSFKARHEYMGKVLKAVKGPAWKKPLELADDPATAQKQIEHAFAHGDLSTEELTALIRSRELQLKVKEHDEMKSRMVALETKLEQLLAQQKGK